MLDIINLGIVVGRPGVMGTPSSESVGAAGMPLLRLLHLVSPSLPVGGFTYSQGLEWAVEAGWVTNAADVEDWLGDQLQSSLARVDLPLAARMLTAIAAGERASLAGWIDLLHASRETSELRAEEHQRGRALADLLRAWALPDAAAWRDLLAQSQTAGFAFAAERWRIPSVDALRGLAFAWAENLTLAAVKLVPLGQTDGQRILAQIAGRVPAAMDLALGLDDGDIGVSSPALAIASARHERQYTRLFRS
jgi:urease accessory protein